MNRAIRILFSIASVCLLILTANDIQAQGAELVSLELGTGFDKASRAVANKLPVEQATVKRSESARMVCATTLKSAGKTYIYHVWLYRGDEQVASATEEIQVSVYDSEARTTEKYSLDDLLNRTEDLRELKDVRAALVIKLPVGTAPAFRTYSVKRIDSVPSLGVWECRVYSAEEKLLGKQAFTVVAE
ncbi:MAG TPA: DUF2914 domain-containing protein [bacterium]|nr:DUF2914 domain-containing protein [bacterium]